MFTTKDYSVGREWAGWVGGWWVFGCGCGLGWGFCGLFIYPEMSDPVQLTGLRARAYVCVCVCACVFVCA